MPSSGWSPSTSGSATSPANGRGRGDAGEREVEHDVHDARRRVDLAEASARADRRAGAQRDDDEAGEREVARPRPGRAQHRPPTSSAATPMTASTAPPTRTTTTRGQQRAGTRIPTAVSACAVSRVAPPWRHRRRRAAPPRSRTARRGRSRGARRRSGRRWSWALGGRGRRWSVRRSSVRRSVGGAVVVEPVVGSPVASSWSMVSVARTSFTARHELAPVGERAEHHVEAERAAGSWKNRCTPAWPADGALEHVGAEVALGQDLRHARGLEQRLVDAGRVVLEQHDQHVVGAELVDRAAGEVADARRERDRRHVQHRVGRLPRGAGGPSSASAAPPRPPTAGGTPGLPSPSAA